MKSRGAQAAVAIVAAMVIVLVIWAAAQPHEDLKYYAEVGPLVTGLVAVLAFIGAVTSIMVQRGLAKKKAAIDVFFKTEMDEKLVTAYEKYNKAVKLMNERMLPMMFFIRTIEGRTRRSEHI
jgi:hypothetical protein